MMNMLQQLRNSSAIVLALTVEEMFPKITLLKGGAIQHGFYYDFLSEQPLEPHLLILIEEKMRGIVKKDMTLEPLSMMRENAIELFRHRKQHAKAQQVAATTQPLVNIVRIGEFFDLCDAPLIDSTEPLRAFKLLSVEPVAHYTPSEGSQTAYRITGAVDSNPQHLKQALKKLESLKKNNLTTLSEELELFSFDPHLGNIAWTWKNKGRQIKDFLTLSWNIHFQSVGYQLTATPPLVKRSLLREVREPESRGSSPVEATATYEGTEYRIPNSLTPSHVALFRSNPTHKKYAEIGTVSSGITDVSLGGLIPPITHADYAHSLCSFEEVEGVIISSLHFIEKIIKIFGFGSRWIVAGRGKKSVGSQNNWEKLQASVARALHAQGITAEEDTLETAYAGPKILCCLIDSLGREWNLPSISLDVYVPEKIGLHREGSGGTMNPAVLVTTRVFGSLEEFIGVVAEHLQGQFPWWMVRELVKIVVVGQKQKAYAYEIREAIRAAGWHADIDESDEQLGKKIQAAERQRMPFVVVIGEHEAQKNTLSVRARGTGRSEMRSVTIKEFLQELMQFHKENCQDLL